MKFFIRLINALALSTLITWSVAGVAPAATLDWTNTSGGAWSTAGNWNPAGPPTDTDDVRFNQAGSSYRVTFAPGDIGRNMEIFNANCTLAFDMGGTTFTNSNNGANGRIKIEDQNGNDSTFLTMLITNGTFVAVERCLIFSYQDNAGGVLIITNGGRLKVLGPSSPFATDPRRPNGKLIVATPSDSSNPAFVGTGFQVANGRAGEPSTFGTGIVHVINGAFARANSISFGSRYRDYVGIGLVSGAGSELRENSINSNVCVGVVPELEGAIFEKDGTVIVAQGAFPRLVRYDDGIAVVLLRLVEAARQMPAVADMGIVEKESSMC